MAAMPSVMVCLWVVKGARPDPRPHADGLAGGCAREGSSALSASCNAIYVERWNEWPAGTADGVTGAGREDGPQLGRCRCATLTVVKSPDAKCTRTLVAWR